MNDQKFCRQTRNSIEDIWGPRTPYRYQWPTRVDENSIEEPDKWVQSACVLCMYELPVRDDHRRNHAVGSLTHAKVAAAMDVDSTSGSRMEKPLACAAGWRIG